MAHVEGCVVSGGGGGGKVEDVGFDACAAVVDGCEKGDPAPVIVVGVAGD